MNNKTNAKNNYSSQNNFNTNPFPKLKPRGSIKINQISKKDENENISHETNYNSNQSNKGNKFLSTLKIFDKNVTNKTEERIKKINEERKRIKKKKEGRKKKKRKREKKKRKKRKKKSKKK